VQASDRSTVFRLGSLELVLELSDAAGGGGGLSQQVLINRNLSIIPRQIVSLPVSAGGTLAARGPLLRRSRTGSNVLERQPKLAAVRAPAGAVGLFAWSHSENVIVPQLPLVISTG